MPTLHQYDYLFAFGVIFCTLDAFMIGANDVANSFATSVSSKSLTMRQATLAAAVFEFLGAVLVGARVSSTIKNGIIPLTIFNNNAGLQLLAFVNAIFVSSVWLSIATKFGWPVSTTYSIVSAVLGAGIAIGGFGAPTWGWADSKGIAAIFSGLVIAPGLAASFGAAVYLLVKYVVLIRRNPVHWGLLTGPFWFFVVACVCTMSIIYKGSPSLGLDEMSPGKTAAAILLTGLVIAVLAAIFWLPYVHAKVVKKDYTIKWYHFFFGPLLWKRPAPEDGHLHDAVGDYRIRKDNEGDAVTNTLATMPNPAHAAERAESAEGSSIPEVTSGKERPGNEKRGSDTTPTLDSETVHDSRLEKEVELGRPSIEGPWVLPKNLWIIVRYIAIPGIWKVLSHGSQVDIHALQAGEADPREAKKMQAIYDAAKQYPNDVEHLYSFLQVMTACTASFAHGANDLSNAIGPFAVIFHTWKYGTPSGKNSDIPVWMLVYGASALVLGLATYGYNIMAVLGNKITLHSPSRGFSMEMGAAITVILASQFGIPVSTTMCITGGTIGVALCNGNLRSINWRQIAWIYFGWIMTIIIVATASACLLAIVINAPRP